jgi:hypothetical protein
MNQDNHRILFGGKVIDISDPDLRGRIRVKPEWEQYQQIVSSLKDIFINGKSVLNDEKTDIRQEFWYKEYTKPAFSDPFVFLSFLPVHLNLIPAVNDYVHLIYYNWSENTGRKNQFYMKGPISTMMALSKENSDKSKSTLASGSNVKPGKPLKSSTGFYNSLTKGVFAEPEDYALYSKGRSDIILKDTEILLRSKKTPILNSNDYPVVNTKRSFLQLSNFDTRTTKSPKKTITQSNKVSEQILKLVEYQITYGLDSLTGPFSGIIDIYNLPGRDPETLTNKFSSQTVITGSSYNSFSHEFLNIGTIEEVAVIINKVISGLNDGRIDLQYITPRQTLNVTDKRFPFYYRPSIATQKISNGPEGNRKANVDKLIGLINFPKSQTNNAGSGLISSKNKYGLQTVSKKTSYTPIKIENGDFGYTVLGSDKIFIVSNSSQIPNYPKIELNTSEVYGINEPTLSGNYYESTNSMVRGEALKDLLTLMMNFLLNHTHMYHRDTPYEYTYDTSPTTKTQLDSEFKLFDNKVLNQNIRIN